MSAPLVPVTPQPGASLSISETRKSMAQMVAQRNAVVEAMKTLMKPDIDYGTIPGTPKPTLYKPGSEKILSMFNLSAEPRVEDLSTPDCIRYRVHVTIRHAPTGVDLGTGVGEASSAESKYQWRAVVCDEEWDDTPEDRSRIKWKKGDLGPYSVRQVRAEMDDVANTVLKMAKKRAQIDAVLTVTAASDIFAQDVEDLKEIGLDPEAAGEGTQTKPEQAELKKKETTQAAAQHGAKCIDEGEGKRFWAVAINRTNDYKLIMDYLKSVHGITKKELILKARLPEAMKWANTGEVDE